MTKDDIKKVVNIMMTADSGCIVCAERLLEQLKDVYPQYGKIIEAIWDEEYGGI